MMFAGKDTVLLRFAGGFCIYTAWWWGTGGLDVNDVNDAIGGERHRGVRTSSQRYVEAICMCR